jgi:hypothetical protein
MQRTPHTATNNALTSMLSDEFGVSIERARAILSTSDGMPEARRRLQETRKPRTERVTP